MNAAIRRLGVIIPSAGSGERMGLGISKGLININGETVIAKTVAKFLTLNIETKIIVAVRAEDLSAYQAILKDLCSTIIGGSSRQKSVTNALNSLAEFKPDFVLVHDAARCFVSEKLIERALAAVVDQGAVTAAVPCTDTIKRVNASGKIIETLDRKELWSIQTPQVFKYQLILEAHNKFCDQEFSDDAGMVEKLAQVSVIRGETTNIKITYPEDLG